MTVGDWLHILQGVSSVGVLVAIAWATLQRGTIQSLRGDNDDLRKRLDDRDKERGEDHTRIADLEGQVKVLSTTVTGEAHLVALTGQLDDHHQESMALLGRIEQAIGGSTR